MQELPLPSQDGPPAVRLLIGHSAKESPMPGRCAPASRQSPGGGGQVWPEGRARREAFVSSCPREELWAALVLDRKRSQGLGGFY